MLHKIVITFVGARLEGPKLEPKGPRGEVGFSNANQGFSSIQGTLFGFYGKVQTVQSGDSKQKGARSQM